MKLMIMKSPSVAAILAVMADGATASAQTVDTRIGRLDFELGVPTKETVEKLSDERDLQRACLAFLAALPLAFRPRRHGQKRRAARHTIHSMERNAKLATQ